jgi:CHAT domain-containing protein
MKKLEPQVNKGDWFLKLPPGTRGSAQKAFVKDLKRPYAHPYFWAPFILIGNWK